MKKLPAKWNHIAVPLGLSFVMSGVSTLIAATRALGLSHDMLAPWTQAWAMAWVVAFPMTSLVLPLVRKFVSLFVERA